MMVAGGGGATLAQLADLARSAEDAGFSGIFLAEAWRSGLVPTAVMAAATWRIEVGP
jgi:alkanesulfonate monooxygenase SsuD/methylene tetrahydromethanopterin reductase-like flavin-dependent oxidoreductase (luciferase family)